LYFGNLWWFIVLAGSSLFTGPWAEAHGGKLKRNVI
jgi:hypothetical protein